MSDRFPAEIHIGGPIPRQLRDQLIQAIVAQGVHLQDYGGPEATEEGLEPLIQEGEFLCLYDDQARYGEFDELEAFLVEHEIHFNRHSDGYCEHNAQWLFFRGSDAPLAMPAEQGAGILLYRENVAEILDDEEIDDQVKISQLRRLVYPPQLSELQPIRFT